METKGRHEKPLDKRRSVAVQFKATMSEKEKLKEAAEALNMTESSIIRRSLSLSINDKFEVKLRGTTLNMNTQEALKLISDITKKIDSLFPRG